MFDEFTFDLRYESVIKIGFMTLMYVIPVPVTRETVERLKDSGVWEHFEPVLGPYCDPDARV
jgi:hypothetical protein